MVNIISEISKDKVFDLLNQGTRVDDRQFSDYRDITIKTDYISKAEGSALVSLGGTTVVAGVKAQIAPPFSNSPDEGILITNAELLAIASRNFEYGPPNKFAVEISRVVDRTIRESPLINLKKLCITEGSEVWKLHVDIYILDYDGNIMDSACIATLCALLTTEIPSATSINGEIIINENDLKKLPIENKSLLCTIVKINDELLIDPNEIEQTLMDASISIGFREDGSICAIQKCGLDVMSVNEVRKAMNLAYNKSRELFDIIDSKL
ncbi:MAG: exosome complex protein Rrp42 [Methanosphaera stadtmanae]|nr:exosome complex protein Rrp42 [Methanosphaera stadtmanae]